MFYKIKTTNLATKSYIADTPKILQRGQSKYHIVKKITGSLSKKLIEWYNGHKKSAKKFIKILVRENCK